MNHEIHYLNTDLELVAATDLTPLAQALSSRHLFQLHLSRRDDDHWHATFETDEQFKGAEPNIEAFVTAVESLEAEPRSLWSACTTRVFDIGYECGEGPRSFHNNVATSILARVAAVGASLRITLYPADRGSQTSHDTKTQVP